MAGNQSSQVNFGKLEQLFYYYKWVKQPFFVKEIGRLNVMMGNPYMGTLHSFINHASQWRKMSFQIEAHWNAFPVKVKTLVNKVEKSSLSYEDFLITLTKQKLRPRMF